jgi:hypothetical protein
VLPSLKKKKQRINFLFADYFLLDFLIPWQLVPVIIIHPTLLQEALLWHVRIDISACPDLPVLNFPTRRDIIIVTVAHGLTTIYMQEFRVSIRQRSTALVRVNQNGFVPIMGSVPG